MNAPAKEQARRCGAQLGANTEGACLSGDRGASTGKSEERSVGSLDRLIADLGSYARSRLAEDRALRRTVRWRYASLGWGAAYLLRRLVLEGPVHVGDSSIWLKHSLINRRFAVLDDRGYMHATESGREAVLNPHLDRRGWGPSPKYPDKVEYHRVEIPPRRGTSFWELNTDPCMAEVLKRRREESAR